SANALTPFAPSTGASLRTFGGSARGRERTKASATRARVAVSASRGPRVGAAPTSAPPFAFAGRTPGSPPGGVEFGCRGGGLGARVWRRMAITEQYRAAADFDELPSSSLEQRLET